MSTSSRNYSKPIVKLQPQVSRLFGLMVVVFALAAAMAWATVVGFPWGWIAALCVLLIGYHVFWSFVLLRGAKQICAAAWRQDGKWDLLFRNGDSFSAELLPSTFSMPLLTILWFRRVTTDGSRGRRDSLILFADSEASATLSLLRARITTDLLR